MADNESTERMLLQQAVKLSPTGQLSIRSTRPFAGLASETTLNKQKVRMVLKLPSDAGKVLSGLKAKVRSQVKKAYKNGLASAMGSFGLLDDFYAVFSENMRDLGSPVHSRKWIHSILKFYGNRAHLGIVYTPSGDPGAAGVILCHPNLVSIPWASSLRRFNKLNPNMMLYWTFLKFAADNGFKSFDFGRSTVDEGTYNFKKQWGAQPESLHWAELFNDDNNNQIEIKFNGPGGSKFKAREHAESIIKKLPVSLSTAFGSSTRKYIPL